MSATPPRSKEPSYGDPGRPGRNATPSGSATAGPAAPRLRFATYLAPNMEPVYRFVADAVGDRLGVASDLQVGRSFDQFARGEVDVGFV